jgi:hypothetical protein
MTRMQELYLREKDGRRRVRVRALVVTIALAGTLFAGGAALADPDFGPGESVKGPQDPGALCHPPGQEPDAPCK